MDHTEAVPSKPTLYKQLAVLNPQIFRNNRENKQSLKENLPMSKDQSKKSNPKKKFKKALGALPYALN